MVRLAVYPILWAGGVEGINRLEGWEKTNRAAANPWD